MDVPLWLAIILGTLPGITIAIIGGILSYILLAKEYRAKKQSLLHETLLSKKTEIYESLLGSAYTINSMLDKRKKGGNVQYDEYKKLSEEQRRLLWKLTIFEVDLDRIKRLQNLNEIEERLLYDYDEKQHDTLSKEWLDIANAVRKDLGYCEVKF